MAASYPTGRPTYDYPFAAIPVDLLTDKDASATAIRVFAILTRFAYEAGHDELQVTHEAIAERIHCSPRSVARPLAQLEELGWIERRICNTGLGRSADYYHLNAQRADERTGAEAQRADSRTRDHADLRGPTTPKERENTLTLLSEDQASADKVPAAQIDQDFEDWWQAYPKNRRVGKAEAKLEYRRARKDTDAETLTSAVIAFARLHKAQATEPKFIPHACRWLKKRRWEDEVPEARSPFEGPEQRFG